MIGALIQMENFTIGLNWLWQKIIISIPIWTGMVGYGCSKFGKKPRRDRRSQSTEGHEGFKKKNEIVKEMLVKMTSSRVIIDADACPKTCMQIIRKLALVYDLNIITVASFNHRIDHINHLVVGDEAQAADIAIMNQVRSGDIVVTQDWGLAAMVLGKKAWAIAPDGRIYEDDRMNWLLEERNIQAKFRRGGGRTHGPAKRTPNDDLRFERNFLATLKQAASGIRQEAARDGDAN